VTAAIILGVVLVLMLVIGGSLVAYQFRALHRELDAIDPMQLRSDASKLQYERLYRKYGWTPRVDPWTGKVARR
jgi:hypothetical protein